MAGESFERAFATRFAEQSLIDVVNNAEGILLFLSAARLVDDVTILEAYGDSTDIDDEDDDNLAPDSEEALSGIENAVPAVNAENEVHQQADISQGRSETQPEPSDFPTKIWTSSILASKKKKINRRALSGGGRDPF